MGAGEQNKVYQNISIKKRSKRDDVRQNRRLNPKVRGRAESLGYLHQRYAAMMEIGQKELEKGTRDC